MPSTRTPFETPITAANLQVRLAQDESEIRASQKLRYRIFYEEMGAHSSAEVRDQERDFDRFDDVCDHLLVINTDLSGPEAVVGTYRLLLRSRADDRGVKFYTEDEYDIHKLLALNTEVLELGRSCVHADYRSRAVMQLLWRGIGEYVGVYKVSHMFGCGSLHGVDPQAHALALSYLYHNHLTPEDFRPTALAERYTKMDYFAADEINQREALSALPALIKGYLRLNGTIGDGAVLDHDFNTTDVCIVVETKLLTEKYYHRYHPNYTE